MTFGLQCDEELSGAILHAADEAGITFLDTADAYPLGGDASTVGATEEILGRWLRSRRERFIVATKCFAPTGPAPWDRGTSRKHILDAIEGSLRRLDTDYVDLYQLHGYDPSTPIDETLAALDDIVHSGKARYVGVSNWPAFRLARALGRSEVAGVVRFGSVQPRYNLLFREFERDLFPLCLEEGIGVIPYNPLAGGLLTGKHQPGGPTEGTRFTLGTAGRIYQQRYWHDREFATVEQLGAIAGRAGVSLTTLAVAWVLANPAITSPIVGASRPEQLADSIRAVEMTIEQGLLAELNDLTAEYRKGDSER
jgi:aryl-alcohol dehydrogenase (NADP+)